jgi:hypothetical protein
MIAAKATFLLTLLGLGLVLSLSAGCGAAGDAVDTVGDSKTATFHGTWKGDDGTEGPAKLVLESHALTASATITLEGHRCADRLFVEGKMSLDGFETKADVGAMHLRLGSNPSITEVLGDFEAFADGPCPGQRGSLATFR